MKNESYIPKYEVKFCSCGSIHFIKWCDIEKASEDGTEIIHICGRCGNGTALGTDDYFDGKALYQRSVPEQFELCGDFKWQGESTRGIHKVIYSKGIRVPMMTGGFADAHYGDTWFDTSNPMDSYKIQALHSYEEVVKYCSDWERRARTVNKVAFSKALTDEQKEVLKGYSYMDALNLEE